MNQTSATRTTDRRTYLTHCARISLQKRWLWIATAAILVGLALSMAGLPLPLVASASLLAALIVAASIAYSSWQRHANDLPDTLP